MALLRNIVVFVLILLYLVLPTSATTFNIHASDQLIYSNDTVYGTSAGVWEKVNIITPSMNVTGTARYYFEGEWLGLENGNKAKVLKNGTTQLSSEWSISNNFYTGYTEDFSISMTTNDTIELWILSLGGGSTTAVRNFRVSYSFDNYTVGNWTFNEGTGTYANDTSGFNNNGTITGATWATNLVNGSVSGTALSFGGTSYVLVNSSASLNLSNSIENSFWFKANTSLDSQNLNGFIVKGTGADPDYFSLIVGGNIRSGFKRSDGTEYSIDTTGYTFSPNTWYFYEWYFNGSNQIVKINGVQNNINTQGTGQTIRQTSSNVSLGAWQSFSKYFDGQMDEVNLYNYALNTSEATTLYQTFHPVPAYPVGGLNIPITTPPMTTAIDFSWHDTEYPADELIVASDSNFNLIVADVYTSADTYSVTLGEGTYYWKVLQYNTTTSTFGDTSATQTFTLSASTTATGQGIPVG